MSDTAKNETKNKDHYQFKKNSADYIRFSLMEYNGSLYVDVRTWRQPDEEGEELRPLVKGVRFNAELWDEFKEGIEAIGASLEGAEGMG